MANRKKDLETPLFDDLSWTKSDAAESLATVFEHVQTLAISASKWYLEAKVLKKKIGKSLRFGAIVVFGIAGVIPVLFKTLDECIDGAKFDATWASILVGIGGIFVVLDRFFGFSSAWTRYTLAELEIQSLLRQFQLNWQAAKSKWPEEGPSVTGDAKQPSDVETMLAMARNFVQELDGIVNDESKQWARDFQNAVREMDRSSKTQRPAS